MFNNNFINVFVTRVVIRFLNRLKLSFFISFSILDGSQQTNHSFLTSKISKKRENETIVFEKNVFSESEFYDNRFNFYRKISL